MMLRLVEPVTEQQQMLVLCARVFRGRDNKRRIRMKLSKVKMKLSSPSYL